MKLSIIVCVYNTEYSLFDECLASIRRSSLKSEDYEIVVIDDGSIIDYSELVERHSLAYTKTENRGIFAARALGISLAKGDYIAFVDSDDYVSFNYHAPMLQLASGEGVDVVFNDWAFNTPKARYFCRSDSTIQTDISAEGDDVLLTYSKPCGREHSYFVLWNKIFKSSLLKYAIEHTDTIIKENPGFNFSEDTLITFFVFKEAKSIKNIHTGYYFYRIHSSQSVNVTTPERLKGQIKCMALTFDVMLGGIGENKHKDIIAAYIVKWRELMARTHYSHAVNMKYFELYELIRAAYHVDKLERSKFKDGSAYLKKTLLPSNIFEIDEELSSLYHSDAELSVSTAHTCKYQKICLRYISSKSQLVKISSDGKRLILPRIPLKDKIIYNTLVYALGMIFFKKGSTLRNFLKRHI